MIRLTQATSDLLSLTTAQNGAQVSVWFNDRTATTYTGGRQATAITGAATTTILSTPATSTVREADGINIKNTFAGAHLMTLNMSVSGTLYPIWTMTLLENESVHFAHGTGWTAMDANGNRKEATSSTFGAITATSITDSGLTATRVVFSGVGGLLSDDSGFTFNATGDILTVGAVNVAGTTAPTTGWYNPSGTLLRTPNAVTVDGAVTASAGVILPGTTANLTLGSNFISNGGTDAGLSFAAGTNDATFSAGVTSGAITATSTANTAVLSVKAASAGDQFYIKPQAAGSGAELFVRNSADSAYEPMAFYAEQYSFGGASTFATITSTGLTVNGTLGVGGLVQFSAYGAGAATFDASGNITSVSDESQKRNIRPYTRGLSDIVSLVEAKGVILYGYTKESGLDQTRDDYAGYSAQVVANVIPEAVGKMNAHDGEREVLVDGVLHSAPQPKRLTLNPFVIQAAHTNALYELHQRVAALEARL